MDSPPPPQIAGQPDQDEAAPVQVIVVACHSQLRRDLEPMLAVAGVRVLDIVDVDEVIERADRGDAGVVLCCAED
ncbi:MAG: hypothetical protein WCS09_20660, partial [Pseudomonadota bacterium]